MKKINLRALAALSFLFAIYSAKAQQTKPGNTSEQYSNSPLWISMMNDPSANYYETIKAFKEYWKDRRLPKEPFESEELETFEKEVGLVNENESEKEREEKLKYAITRPGELSYATEVRAFKGWLQNVKPWLRQDGTIISAEEQQAIINKQQAELKEIEQRNGKK